MSTNSVLTVHAPRSPAGTSLSPIIVVGNFLGLQPAYGSAVCDPGLTPAGHVSLANAEQAEREAVRREVLAEREAAAPAELERAVDARIAERWGAVAGT